jgi:hypothetical protein
VMGRRRIRALTRAGRMGVAAKKKAASPGCRLVSRVGFSTGAVSFSS